MKKKYLFRNLTLLVLLAFTFEAYTQVLWYADLEKPLTESFRRFDPDGNSNPSGNQCVDDPNKPPTVSVLDHDTFGKYWRITKPTSRKRAEFARTITREGVGYEPSINDVVYIGWRWRITSPHNINKGIAVFQAKTDAGSFTNTQNYPFNFEYDGTYLMLNCYGPGDPDWTQGSSITNRKTTIWRRAVSKGDWNRIVLRVKFSRQKSSGWLELYFNGTKQTLTNLNFKEYTVDLSSDNKRAYHKTYDGRTIYFKWGSYNENACNYHINTDFQDMRVGLRLQDANPRNFGSGTGDPIVHMAKRNAPDFALDGGHSGANNQNVKLFASNTSNVNQQWVEINRGGGYYSYQKVDTDFCLDGGNSGANGQNVKLWTCSAENQNQHWKKIDAGSGHFRLQKRNASGFSIDGGNGGENQQNVYLWTTNSSNQNQQWKFTTVGTKSGLATEVDESLSIKENHVVVYPNPSSGLLNIDFVGDDISKGLVQIYDFSGRKVHAEIIANKKTSLSLNHLAKGIYIVNISSETINYKEKIVIE
jgi:hypothetical protein